MTKYDPQKIERKWQKEWEKREPYKADDNSSKPKYYQLETFPYPSAAGLHVGHPKGYIAEDIHARYMRMNGKEVLYTMGWDAFGLPTENYAIKVGKSPQDVATENIKNFKRQVKMFGLSYDWSREINTSSPEYYKWTQWLFLQLYKKGLAYRAMAKVNWCPKDQTVLANEQVVDGRCERDGEPVEQKDMEQWFFKITDYADRLIDELKGLDWPEATLKRQLDWIGKSEGAEIKFIISGNQYLFKSIDVFTTRPDTLFGATFLVISPEKANAWLSIKDPRSNKSWEPSEKVRKYITESSNKKELDRLAGIAEKTGVDSGIKAINPATNQEIPIWIADYVLGSYGTGAIMAVPAHDQRDWEFAKKFKLPIQEVVIPKVIDHVNPPREDKPTIRRTNVHAIVYDPKKDTYLALHSEKFNWNTVIIGGVEEGEDFEAAARREVQEETGYTDLTFKRILGGPVQAAYFAKHKDQNRVAVATGVYFELNSDQKITPTETEVGEIIWVPAKEFSQGYMVNSELPFWLERIYHGEASYSGHGVLIDSGKFDGLDSEEAKWKITENIGGRKKIQYKLRDWSVSRQRYWGVPIPMIDCSPPAGRCGMVPVPEKDLPVILPKLEDYRPKGMPPLASSKKFMEVKCPKCGGDAKRVAETLDTFVDSSWYYMRYADPHNSKEFASAEKLQHWLPVDLYIIGAEHTVLHLLYSRFITKFLKDQGYLNFEEPFLKLRHVGLIQGSDGQKMSKSRGNVINPDEVVEQYGADTLRLYEMFMGPFEYGQPWDTKGMVGLSRFLNRVWSLANSEFKTDVTTLGPILHRVIKKIGEDVTELKFNTAISELMKLLNEAENLGCAKKQFEIFVILLAPFAPHLAEEIWHEVLGHKTSIHLEAWPKYDEKLLKEDKVQIVVQVNGKVRDIITVDAGLSEDVVTVVALESENVKRHIGFAKIKKIIYIESKVLNIVVVD